MGTGNECSARTGALAASHAHASLRTDRASRQHPSWQARPEGHRAGGDPSARAAPAALLFGGEANAGQDNLLEQAIARLVAGDEWEFDPVVKRNGPRYKRLRHRESLAACDLFITDCRCWAVIYALRTGPSDFSKALVSRALGMGMFVEEGLLHGHRRVYGKDDKPLPCPRGAACSLIIPTPEEEDFFRSLKLPVWSPAKRSLARLMNDFRGGKP
jgi:hypothetical protein